MVGSGSFCFVLEMMYLMFFFLFLVIWFVVVWVFVRLEVEVLLDVKVVFDLYGLVLDFW